MTESKNGLSKAERIDRSRARAWVLQVMYRWESAGAEGTLRDAFVDTVATRRISPKRAPYVREIVRLLDEHGTEVDAALQSALDNWRLGRLSTLDRAVLRIAATEMLFLEDIPPKVSIQEAIRLAEQYGGPESPRFVNGVLDALFKGHAEITE